MPVVNHSQFGTSQSSDHASARPGGGRLVDQELDEDSWTTLQELLEGCFDEAGTDYGDMFCHSKLFTQAPPPCLQISGVGMIGLLLAPRDAKVIMSRASRAGNGKGGIWEIDSSKLSFANPQWPAFIKKDIHSTVCSALGIESETRMDLHNLTLYEPGSSCTSPKVKDNAFVAVTILLPSPYSGGQVHLTNGSTTKSIDFSADSLVSTGLLAWYSSVGSKVEEVTSGYRLSLTYRMTPIAPSGPTKFRIPRRKDLVLEISRILQKWHMGKLDAPKVPYVAYILDGTYDTKDLKSGHQALRHNIMNMQKLKLARDAGEPLGFKLFLANVLHVASGPAEYEFHNKRWSYEYDDETEEPTMASVENQTTSITDLFDLDGNAWFSPYHSIDIDEDNFVERVPFSFDDDILEEEPDEVEFDGYRGQWDEPVKYRYERSAIVIVHTSDMDNVFSKAGGALYASQRSKMQR